MTKHRYLYSFSYVLWLLFFVLLPLFFIVGQSFKSQTGQWTLANYLTFFSNSNYLEMAGNSFLYALIITVVTLVIAYPMAYVIVKSRYKELLLAFVILPTWINILLKAYAFIGLFSHSGAVNQFLRLFGIGPFQFLFRDASFIFVAAYIELPFMILPIFNSLNEMRPSYIAASEDLGATKWETLRYIIFPLSLNGVRSGIQTVFIPTLSLFMIARLIGGNRVITLGTAVEQHFLVTQNWGMGSTIGVILILVMFVMLYLIRDRKKGGVRYDGE